jgi:single-strand DNA-binding protein
MNEIELKMTNTGTEVVSITIACERDFKDKDGNKQTDFIDVIAFKNTANFLSRFFTKGRMAIVNGRLQTRTWEDKNGNKRTAVEIVAENVSFCGSKAESGNTYGAARQEAPAVSYQSADAGSFSVLPDDNQGFPFGSDDDEGLPF